MLTAGYFDIEILSVTRLQCHPFNPINNLYTLSLSKTHFFFQKYIQPFSIAVQI